MTTTDRREPLVISRAREEHFAAIGEILVSAYAAAGYFQEWGDDPANPDDSYIPLLRDVAARSRDSTVLVALLGSEPVGSITMTAHGSPVAEIAHQGEAELRMLGVHPHHRGRGIASALLDAAIDEARAAGATGLVLLSIEPPEHVERRYLRRGFVRVPERDEHWDDEALAAGTVTPYPVWRLDLGG